MQIWKSLHELTASTQRCDNVVVKAQRRVANTQHCSDECTTT